MFLNDNQYFYDIYIRENAHWDRYVPPPLANHYTIFFFISDVYCYK